MTEVFISYARHNTGFVRELYSALLEREFTAWVDWEGIPPSADWLEEIFHAIEASDSFIFVLTPASCASQICLTELNHALRHHKRIIPLVHEEAAKDIIPASIARLNWLFARPQDDFAGAMQQLVTTINTDLNRVKSHTRLLVKALEWENRHRETSLLLHGNDLAQAEAWLAQAAQTEPQATALQSEFITSSRTSAQRRKKFTLLSAAAVLLVVAVTGLVAWQQRLQKQQESSRATLAAARELAARSREENGDKGMLLAIEALRDAQTVTRQPVPEIYSALLQQTGVERFEPRVTGNRPGISSYTYGVSQLVFADATHLLGTADHTEALRVWTLCTDTPAAASCDKKPEKTVALELAQKPDSIALNSTGTTIITLSGEQLSRYHYDGSAVKKLCDLPAAIGGSRIAALSPAGDWLALRYGHNLSSVLLRRADCDSAEPVTIDLTPDNNSVSAFAFHPDDGAVFVAEAGGRIYVRAIDDGAVRLIDSGFADNDTVQSLAVSGAGRWLALSNQHDLRLLDLAADTPAAIRLCCDDDTRVLQVMGFSHDSKQPYLAAFHQYSQNGEMRLWRIGDDPALSAPIRFAVPRKEHDEPNVRVHAIAFSHDDRWLATALDGDNRSILLWPLTPADWLTLACSRLQTAPSGSSAAGPVASLCP